MRPMWAATVLLALFGCIRLGGGRPGGPQPGEKLIDVELQTLDGKKALLSDLTRGRVAIVEFHETWCNWCTRQIRDLNETAKAFPSDQVAIVQIDIGEDAKKVEADRAANQPAFPTLLDPHWKAANRYGVDTIPDVVIVGHDGTILYRASYTTAARIRRVVEPALKAMEDALSGKAPEKK